MGAHTRLAMFADGGRFQVRFMDVPVTDPFNVGAVVLAVVTRTVFDRKVFLLDGAGTYVIVRVQSYVTPCSALNDAVAPVPTDTTPEEVASAGEPVIGEHEYEPISDPNGRFHVMSMRYPADAFTVAFNVGANTSAVATRTVFDGAVFAPEGAGTYVIITAQS